MREETARAHGGRSYRWAALLVLAVFFLLPNLRLPAPFIRWVWALVAWAGAAFFLLGLLGRVGGRPGRAAQGFFATVGVVFLLLEYTPAVLWMTAPLAVAPAQPAKARVAVVLGAGIRLDDALTENSIRRAVAAAQLYHRGLAPKLLFSTGVRSPSGLSEARAMGRFVRTLGVPERAILLEEGSWNTRENASYSARMLRERGIRRVLLVTDPLHMFRARESFAAEGIVADPASANDAEGLWDAVGGWSFLQRGVHEYLGILYYRLRRRIG